MTSVLHDYSGAYTFARYTDDVKSAYIGLKTILDNGLYETMIQPIKQMLGDYLPDLTFQNGTVCAGHAAGLIIFEVVVGVVTGGVSQFKNVFQGIGKGMKGIGSIGKVLKKGFTDGISDLKRLKCKIVSGGCFVAGTSVLMAGKSQSKTNIFYLGNTAKGLAVAATMPIVAVPIQDVQLLDYAVAHETINSNYGLTASAGDMYMGLFDKDPYTSDQQRTRDTYKLNNTDWNEVVFEEVLGTSICKLALHQDWINQNAYVVEGLVNLDLPEQGISGPFKITSIKHILPQKKPVDEDDTDDYSYKPVTAIFIHQSDAVYNITFVADTDQAIRDYSETIGVTYQHPVYSVTAGDWRLAGELEVGEKVLTKSGESTVASTEKKGGYETVYNLEVKDLHNFLVGDEGVVVHNGCGWLSDVIKMSTSQIKKKYRKHAKDFGLAPNYNAANGNLWKQTLKDFVGADGKKHFPDVNYRGQFTGICVFEESSGLMVLMKADGEFVTAFKLGPSQIDKLLNNNYLD